MKLLAHRGHWLERAETNSFHAFERAWSNGYGIETDLRDLDGAVATYFEAYDSCYSYFTFGSDGSVASAAEKKVISSHASAGTYIFRSAGHFIAATGRAVRDSREELTVGQALFVCPVLNTIVRQGLKVIALEARNVRSVSKLLHAA